MTRHFFIGFVFLLLLTACTSSVRPRNDAEASLFDFIKNGTMADYAKMDARCRSDSTDARACDVAHWLPLVVKPHWFSYYGDRENTTGEDRPSVLCENEKCSETIKAAANLIESMVYSKAIALSIERKNLEKMDQICRKKINHQAKFLDEDCQASAFAHAILEKERQASLASLWKTYMNRDIQNVYDNLEVCHRRGDIFMSKVVPFPIDDVIETNPNRTLAIIINPGVKRHDDTGIMCQATVDFINDNQTENRPYFFRVMTRTLTQNPAFYKRMAKVCQQYGWLRKTNAASSDSEALLFGDIYIPRWEQTKTTTRYSACDAVARVSDFMAWWMHTEIATNKDERIK